MERHIHLSIRKIMLWCVTLRLAQGLACSSILISFYKEVSLLLSFLFYFLGCLPLANHKEMTRVYDKRRNGLYYYSQQPRNNYYDSIRHPVSFETALPYIYLLFVLVIAFVLVQWSFLVFSGKEKSKK